MWKKIIYLSIVKLTLAQKKAINESKTVTASETHRTTDGS